MKPQYKEVTTSVGITVRVYPVPDTVILALLPGGESEPIAPKHVMDTAVGKQERDAKPGDPEWEVYHVAHERWEERANQLHQDARLVAAVRESTDQPDFDWPDEITPDILPLFIRLTVQSNQLEWPEDPLTQMALWFLSVIAPTQDDLANIVDAISLLSGTDPALIASFREELQRKLREELFGGQADDQDLLLGSVEGSEGSTGDE